MSAMKWYRRRKGSSGGYSITWCGLWASGVTHVWGSYRQRKVDPLRTLSLLAQSTRSNEPQRRKPSMSSRQETALKAFGAICGVLVRSYNTTISFELTVCVSQYWITSQPLASPIIAIILRIGAKLLKVVLPAKHNKHRTSRSRKLSLFMYAVCIGC